MGVYAGDARSFAGKCFSVPRGDGFQPKSDFWGFLGKRPKNPKKAVFWRVP